VCCFVCFLNKDISGFVYFLLVVLCLDISIGAVDCVDQMACYMLSGSLNSTHTLSVVEPFWLTCFSMLLTSYNLHICKIMHHTVSLKKNSSCYCHYYYIFATTFVVQKSSFAVYSVMHLADSVVYIVSIMSHCFLQN